jgi:hypothetical protein
MIEKKENLKKRLQERINIFHNKKYSPEESSLPVVARITMNSTFREYN